MDYQKWRIRTETSAVVLCFLVLALVAGSCDLRSTTPATATATNLKVALIGDSVAAKLKEALGDPGFGGPADVSWTITAQPGAGWGEGEDSAGNWPLGVVQGTTVADRIRTAAEDKPSVLVLELGTNDALRASFAYSLNNGSELLERIVGTDNNIRADVSLASSLSRCVVLISPSYYPTSAFAEEQHYSATALQIRKVLLTEVSAVPGHTVLLADWAALSSTHRVASGSPENWFTADDLHPNTVGLKALANLIVRTAKPCAA